MTQNGIDHLLHGITLFSVVIAIIGFLFASYGFLDRPHGILRWLIQVIVPGLVFALPLSIFAFFLPESWVIGPFSLKGIVTNFAFYGGLIGFFNGLFADSPTVPSSQSRSNVPNPRAPEQLTLPFQIKDVAEDLPLLVSTKGDALQQAPLLFNDTSVFIHRAQRLWKHVSLIWNRFLKDGVNGIGGWYHGSSIEISLLVGKQATIQFYRKALFSESVTGKTGRTYAYLCFASSGERPG